MKHILSFLVVLILASGVFAQKTPPMPKFEEAVSFYISFDDETPNADITEGREKPFAVMGKKRFVEGIRGKALLCGQNGAKLRYYRKDNMNFDQAGTIVFFYKGIFKTLKSGPRTFFWGIESTSGYIGQHLSNDPKTKCPCQRELHTMFLYGKKIKNRTLFSKIAKGEAGCEKWHMIAFSWAPGQLNIKYDNDPSKSYSIPFEMSNADFPTDHFSIGSNTHWEYYLDEFTIYNRRLSDAELSEIYQHYFKQ